MSSLKEQVGQLLKGFRKEQGLTQKELGEKLGVTATTIKRYELGSQNLTLDTIEKIVTTLGVRVELKKA